MSWRRAMDYGEAEDISQRRWAQSFLPSAQAAPFVGAGPLAEWAPRERGLINLGVPRTARGNWVPNHYRSRWLTPPPGQPGTMRSMDPRISVSYPDPNSDMPRVSAVQPMGLERYLPKTTLPRPFHQYSPMPFLPFQ